MPKKKKKRWRGFRVIALTKALPKGETSGVILTSNGRVVLASEGLSSAIGPEAGKALMNLVGDGWQIYCLWDATNEVDPKGSAPSPD